MSSSMEPDSNARNSEAVRETEAAAVDNGQAGSTDETYDRAARVAIARMRRGFHSGGGPFVSRDELHDR